MLYISYPEGPYGLLTEVQITNRRTNVIRRKDVLLKYAAEGLFSFTYSQRIYRGVSYIEDQNVWRTRELVLPIEIRKLLSRRFRGLASLRK